MIYGYINMINTRIKLYYQQMLLFHYPFLIELISLVVLFILVVNIIVS